MAALLAFSIEKGEDLVFSGTQTVPPGTIPAGPMDITSWTILVTIRTPAGAVFITKPGSVVSGPAGTYTWTLSNSDTVGAAAGIYTIDIWRTDAGLQRSMGEGTIVINSDVRFV